MGAGIRAEVAVDALGTCPVAEVSATAEASCHTVSRSIPPDDDTITEEFRLADEPSVPPTEVDPDLEEVFSYGGRRVYRFERERGTGCPCECIERFGCPVADVATREGTLLLTFHAEDVDTLRDIVAELREDHDVDVRRLLRAEDSQGTQDLVFVDRGRLTDKQREALETAHEMGYFDHPKGANAGEVADELGVATATFTEHLAAAQRKLLAAVLAD